MRKTGKSVAMTTKRYTVVFACVDPPEPARYTHTSSRTHAQRVFNGLKAIESDATHKSGTVGGEWSLTLWQHTPQSRVRCYRRAPNSQDGEIIYNILFEDSLVLDEFSYMDAMALIHDQDEEDDEVYLVASGYDWSCPERESKRLGKEIAALQARQDVAYDVAIDDGGASLNRLERQIEELVQRKRALHNTLNALDAPRPVIKVKTGSSGDETSPVEAESDAGARDEADPTGYEPGKGSAYDYIPSWMVIPPPYGTENAQEPPPAIVKLFTPDSNWTWYILEHAPEEDLAFGLTVGFETELGYISIAELREIKGPLGLKIERDLWWRPRPITQVNEYIAEWGEHGGPYKGRVEEAEAENAELEPEVHTLTFGDNGVQVYFEGEEHLLLNPYTDRDGTRYGGGWCWHYRNDSTGMEWRCLEDPDRGPDSQVGGYGLQETVACAERVTGLRFELTGTPEDLPDSYPTPPAPPEQATIQTEAEASPAEEGKPEVTLAVDAETMETIHATYSAQVIAEHNRIKKPFTVDGAEGLWICTGSYGDRLKCHLVIPRDQYEGETNADAYYKGRVVKHRKKEYVLSDQLLWVTLDEHAPAPAPEEASADLDLAHLYRDWLSVTSGAGWAYPSVENRTQYQQCAEELVVGGEREREGTDFRRFCRVRLETQHQGLDLAAAEAYRSERDFPPMDGWECLEETDEHFYDRSWEAKRKPTSPCVRCGKPPDDDEGWLWQCGCPVYLCPNCHEDLLAWKDTEIAAHKAEAKRLDSAVRSARAKAAHARKAQAQPQAAPKRKLPDDIPDVIEVDQGRTKGWSRANALRVDGKWLYYRLQDGGETEKVQVIGRDILWRAPTQVAETVQ